MFRSTLKKVQSQWSGQVQQGITGSASLLVLSSDNSQIVPIAGKLTNTTGQNLKSVYLFFTYGWQDINKNYTEKNDRMLYIPAWNNGVSIDLAAEYTKAHSIMASDGDPGNQYNVSGRINADERSGFVGYLYNALPGSSMTEEYDDRNRGYVRTLPLLSIPDRLGPAKRNDANPNRPEPVRRGFRDLDVSQLVAAGKLVIVGHAAESPVPLQMDVNGDRVAGIGTTIYQVALPLNRMALKPAPATQPTSQPTTQPATQPVGESSPRSHGGTETSFGRRKDPANLQVNIVEVACELRGTSSGLHLVSRYQRDTGFQPVPRAVGKLRPLKTWVLRPSINASRTGWKPVSQKNSETCSQHDQFSSQFQNYQALSVPPCLRG